MVGCATYNVAFDAAGLIATVGRPDGNERTQLVQLDGQGRRLSTVRGPGDAYGNGLSVAADGRTVLTGMCNETTTCYIDVSRAGAVLIEHRYRRDPMTEILRPAW